MTPEQTLYGFEFNSLHQPDYIAVTMDRIDAEGIVRYLLAQLKNENAEAIHLHLSGELTKEVDNAA